MTRSLCYILPSVEKLLPCHLNDSPSSESDVLDSAILGGSLHYFHDGSG